MEQKKKITSNGQCQDCGNNPSVIREPFLFYDEMGEESGFWYCSYCGSNHVTVTYNGEVFDQA